MTVVTTTTRGGRAALATLLLLGMPSVAPLGAQAAVITAPKQAAQRAAAASNAQLQTQMTQAAQAQAITPAGAQRRPQATTQAPTQQATTGRTQGGAQTPGVVQAGAPDPRTRAPDPSNTIMREVFHYASEGRRDPFFSLMATGDLRPMLSDLRLTTIIFDRSGRRSVAVMNDVSTNLQYRVTTGMMLGRMRVTQINPRKVVFAIDEFGFSRADSLVLAEKPLPRK